MQRRDDIGAGDGGTESVLLALPAGFGHVLDPRPRFSLSDVRLTADLGERIGSAGWFRGAATLAVLVAACLHFAPGVRPLPRFEAPAPRVSAPVRRLLAVQPVAVAAPPAAIVEPAPEPATGPGPIRYEGKVGRGLYASQRAAGIPFAIIAAYVRVIALHVDLDRMAASDRTDLVYEPGKGGRLLYAGIVRGGKTLRYLRWTLDGEEQWLDAAGAGEPREGFVLPVTGAHLTSGFGMRVHPILGFSRMHQGVDLAAPEGAPIVAATDGIVSFAGWHGGHGNFVQLVHAGGMGTGYGHMSGFVVQPGQQVRQGQLLGYVGSTGLSTGPHCHFEVYRDGVAIDPATARFESTPRVEGAEARRFAETMARFTALPIR